MSLIFILTYPQCNKIMKIIDNKVLRNYLPKKSQGASDLRVKESVWDGQTDRWTIPVQFQSTSGPLQDRKTDGRMDGHFRSTSGPFGHTYRHGEAN